VFAFRFFLRQGWALRFATVRPRCSKSQRSLRNFAQSLRQEKLLDVQQLDADAAEESLRTGRWRYSQSLGPTAQWCISMTIPIPKAAPPNACGSSYTKGAGVSTRF